MKRILSLIITITMICGVFTGCGLDETEPPMETMQSYIQKNYKSNETRFIIDDMDAENYIFVILSKNIVALQRNSENNIVDVFDGKKVLECHFSFSADKVLINYLDENEEYSASVLELGSIQNGEFIIEHKGVAQSPIGSVDCEFKIDDEIVEASEFSKYFYDIMNQYEDTQAIYGGVYLDYDMYEDAIKKLDNAQQRVN